MGIDKDLNAIARKVNKGKYINSLLYPLVNSILGLKMFHLAAKYNWKGILEFLVKKGIKVNVRDRNGNIALHFASKNGHLNILLNLAMKKLLIKNGADMRTASLYI
ncbi:ankyrin repeat domain-containing protein [Candidatus Mesenet endosymbiont of Agriotes lineatus]|uniref:ankyrin repeat domain-containing protein n=1 Tax=Candidatus Mesenet endosymbiont of Agriotes lineatus TaxID=3077948 RepID=UPI0030CACC6A